MIQGLLRFCLASCLICWSLTDKKRPAGRRSPAKRGSGGGARGDVHGQRKKPPGGGSPRLRLGNCGILWFSPGGEPESAGGSRRGRRGTFRERPRAEQYFRATHRIRDYQKKASNRPLWLDAFFFESVFHRFRRRRTLSPPAGQASPVPGPDRSRRPPYASSARRNAMIFFSSLDTLTCDSPRLSATSCWVISR